MALFLEKGACSPISTMLPNKLIVALYNLIYWKRRKKLCFPGKFVARNHEFD
jgi:hypothetical protein